MYIYLDLYIFIFPFVYVVCMYVLACFVCVRGFLCMWKPEVALGESSSKALPLYSVRPDASVRPRLTSVALLADRLVLGVLCLCLSDLKLRVGPPCPPSLYVGSRDLNSGF